jgi:uncharacterized membrane protein YqaE (UPF0057 family)
VAGGRSPPVIRQGAGCHRRVVTLDNKIVAIIVALLLPPLAVFLKRGAGKDLLINILLCLFGWIPGVIHGLWVVTR